MNMNITRDIVKDLLPLYAAGEGSADSRAAVEAALRDDAELRQLAAALGETSAPSVELAAPTADRKALGRLKRHLRLRTWLIAVAIASGLMPFAFVMDARPGVNLLFPDTWQV